MRRVWAWVLILVWVAGCGFEERGKEKRTVRLSPLPVSEAMGLSSLLRPGSSATDLAVRDFQLRMNQAAGIKYLRNEFMWHLIEQSRGHFDFSGYDEIVMAAATYDRKFIGLLCYGAPWAAEGSGGNIMYPPDDPADFYNFAYQTVRRYRDYIKYWEVWNEENAERFWKPAPDPEAYGYLLKAAAEGVHAADPEAKVAFGAPAPIYDVAWGTMWGFVEEVFAFHPDLSDYIDVLAIHTYTWVQTTAPELEDPAFPMKRSVPTMIREARETLKRWGAGDKPIWITEIGWYTAPNDPLGTVTEEEQAQYLVRSFILSVAHGVDIYCWYTWRDSWDWMNDSEDAFGLVAYDPNPLDDLLPRLKPAYTAYANLYQVLKDTHFEKDARQELKLRDSQYAFRFQTPDGAKRVTVLWTTEPEQTAVLVPPGEEMTRFTVVDMLGNEKALLPTRGYLAPIISQSPVYLVEEK